MLTKGIINLFQANITLMQLSNEYNDRSKEGVQAFKQLFGGRIE
jgi:hypothetical protein